jgi:hypothetical protein
MFSSTMERLLPQLGSAEFLLDEAERLFGPWLQDELAILHRFTHVSVKDLFDGISAAPMDSAYEEWVNETISNIRISKNLATFEDEPEVEDVRNIVTDVSEIFIQLYDLYELPAREETTRIGRAVLNMGNDVPTNLKRLEKGIPWDAIVHHLTDHYNIDDSREVRDVLSLMLDIANDVGISVPITCVSADVIFRAFRHGEDVKWSDQELSLAWETIHGWMEATSRTDIPNLVLEKLLVLLIRVGAARHFVEPWYGASGKEGVVRIGFNLKGAVPILGVGRTSSADRDIWLSKYLLQRKVLARKGKGRGPLSLTQKPISGNHLNPAAPDMAYELGHLLGLLRKQAGSSAPLDDKAMILLASCTRPRDVAAALNAELNIFTKCYRELPPEIRLDASWSDQNFLEQVNKLLIEGKSREAVNSTFVKYRGHVQGAVPKIISAGTDYLRDELKRPLDARKWESYWREFTSTDVKDEALLFAVSIDDLAKSLWQLGCLQYVAELGVQLRLAELRNMPQAPIAELCVERLLAFYNDMKGTGLQQPTFLDTLYGRVQNLRGLARTKTQDGRVIFDFACRKIFEIDQISAPLADRVDEMVRRFGRILPDKEYQYLIWYDMVDSTATKAARENRDVEQWREQVTRFKADVNDFVSDTMRDARGRKVEIHCQNGSHTSANDEKHIFVETSRLADSYAGVIVNGIAKLAAQNGIALRVLVANCSFAGDRIRKYEGRTEVEGLRFFEYLSRIKKEFDTMSRQEPGDGFPMALVGGVSLHLTWLRKRRIEMRPEIAFLERPTSVDYGVIAP